MKRPLILSIDGGGIRGIFPAALLAHVEAQTKKPSAEIFDLIAGTSTGGILAAALAVEIPAKDLVQLYLKEAKTIFPQRPLIMGLASWIRKPKYSAKGLERVLTKHFGGKTFGDCKTRCLLTGVSLLTRRFKTWKSWYDHDVFLRNAARCTSAAPTYFSASADGYIDGGVAANNPGACAIIESFKLWPGEKPQVLSLGCGERPHFTDIKQASNAGLLGYSTQMIGLFMDTSASKEDYFCSTLINGNYKRIHPMLPESISGELDCIEEKNLENLLDLARDHHGIMNGWMKEVGIL
jgi:hypothetical protein